MTGTLALTVAAALAVSGIGANGDYASLPGGSFRSALDYEDVPRTLKSHPSR